MRDAASSSWGLAQGCAPNETFVLGDYELRFDVSAIKGVRPKMEDRWNVAVRPDGAAAVLAVYDGHGGDRVSHYLMSSLSAHVLADEHLETDPEGALRRACASCDERSVLDSPGVDPRAPPGSDDPRDPARAPPPSSLSSFPRACSSLTSATRAPSPRTPPGRFFSSPWTNARASRRNAPESSSSAARFASSGRRSRGGGARRLARIRQREAETVRQGGS